MDFTYKARQESPNKIWFEIESAKREKGLQNEIDENEIRSAGNGARNRWHKYVIKYPEIFAPVLNYECGNWKEILDCIRNDQSLKCL